MTNPVIDVDGNLIWVHTGGQMSKWSSVPSITNLYDIKTPDIDFGQSAQMKKLYKVFVTFKCASGSMILNYSVNSSGSFTTAFASLQVGEDTGWKTESFKIPADNNHNKVYSIQFRISQGISEPVGFELNDISVVYRLRSPGIEAPTTESETIIYSELPSDPAEPGGDGFRS